MQQHEAWARIRHTQNVHICTPVLMATKYPAVEHIEASLCQGVRDIFFEARDLRVSGSARPAGRSVSSGPGVAVPKSRSAGCNPAALASVSFPGCPPGPASWPDAAAAA